MVVTVAALAAACGGGSSGGAATSAAAPSTGATTSAGGGSVTAPAEAPSTITVGFGAKILTLDPDLALGTHDLAALHLIGGYLYELRAGGKVVPSLAEDASTSSDGLTWTFKLRSGLKFSDGTDLTSADVKATIERSLSDKSNGYIGLVNPIKSVDAPDPQTAVFHLNRPYPSLPTVLAEPALMIMPKAGLAQGKSFFDAPISAGPYKLQSWGGGNDSTYVVNDLYWGPKPLVKTLHFTTIEDFNTRLAQVKSGQLNMAVDLPPSLIPQLQSTSGLQWSLVPIYGFATLNMWDGNAPLNNVNVRKAISLAVDRNQLNQVIWGGKAQIMSDFWPPSMTGFDPNISTARDVNKAKQLLAGTPCANGCTLTLEYSPSVLSCSDQGALIVAQNLKDIGINIKLAKLEYTIWSDHQVNGKYELALAFLYDYVDIPDGMLAYGFTKAGGLNANFSGWTSKAADAAALKAIESSGDARTAALADVNRIFAAEQPYATLANANYLVAQNLPTNLLSLEPSGFVEIGREGT
jgi:ABC-type transport system substrate-binding protein